MHFRAGGRARSFTALGEFWDRLPAARRPDIFAPLAGSDRTTDKQHHYIVETHWTGSTGHGTGSYRSYERSHEITAEGKPPIFGSSDPLFRGDPSRWNPEELLVASLSACHQLWYLGLCAQAGVTVIAYEDCAEGVMMEEAGGAGQFRVVTLRPQVRISADSDEDQALTLHEEAHAMCFIARSMNFFVSAEPTIAREGAGST